MENLGFLNTDVPFNVLFCFPTKILLGLKCVSKGWHQLIFDRSFIQAQLQKQKPIVSGFIFQRKYHCISGAMKISKQLATFLLLNQKMKVKVVNSAAKGD